MQWSLLVCLGNNGAEVLLMVRIGLCLAVHFPTLSDAIAG